MAGLSVSNVVSVDINMSPLAIPQRNFGALLIAGSSNVIDAVERVREYATLTEVSNDFLTTSPEWLAADLFFSQAPQPSILSIGRWLQTASSAALRGNVFTLTQQPGLLTALQAVTSGMFDITIGGVATHVTTVSFTGASNLNGCASLISAKLSPTAACVWTGEQFIVTTTATGVTATITYASTPVSGTGTDISAMLGLTAASGAAAPAGGAAAESALAGAVALRAHPEWYGLMFAVTTPLADSDRTAIAQFIEGCDPVSIYGITTSNTQVLDPTITTDIASVLKSMVLQRTFIQFSSSTPHAVASMFGRAFTTDFEANNTMITLKFKQEPGVIGEQLTQTQAQALNGKNCNVFVFYSNGAAIIQEGVMCGGYFFDERQGMDWQANRIQNDVFNVLYTSLTKIPQTDAGVHILVTTVTNSLIQGVNNGLIAPGQWNASGFGQLKQGDALPLGFYVYAPQVASQPQSIREQRIAPTIQCAMKLAGAVHFADVVVNVNR